MTLEEAVKIVMPKLGYRKIPGGWESTRYHPEFGVQRQVMFDSEALPYCRDLNEMCGLWAEKINREESCEIYNLSIDFGEACLKNDKDAALSATVCALDKSKE